MKKFIQRILSPRRVAPPVLKTPYFRIQDSKGRGPFRPGFSSTWSIDRPDQENLPSIIHEFRLSPQDFYLDGYRLHVGCACNSVTLLRRWFIEEEYRKLLQHGYFAVMVIPDKIIFQSKAQSIIGCRNPFAVEGQRFNLYPRGL